MNLFSLGWSAFFESEELDMKRVARIIAIHRSHMRAATEQKELNLYWPGQADFDLAVGDWVMTTPEFVDEQNEPAAIAQKMLPRRSKISRAWNRGEQVIATNIDTVFIVTSANQDLNINRLHRFLVLIREGGANPVVILSKVDLITGDETLINDLKAQLKVEVIGTSLVDHKGIAQVLKLMPEGTTSVFVGSSGVGKSTLVNGLLGNQVQSTKGIREDDGKGRHTTTSRQLFAVLGHGLIIDTPGVREVQVFGSSESLHETFPQIEALARQCKFSDCQHESEPGCAIQNALKSKELDEALWENYKKLLKEMAFSNRKLDKAEMANAKKRWRDIHVAMRKKRKFEEGG